MSTLQLFICAFVVLYVDARHFHHIDNNVDVSPALPKRLNYTLVYRDHRVEHLNFTKVQRSIANRNLPVWIAYKDSSQSQNIFFKKIEMSNDVGEFTFYHDKATNSSLVYFHKSKIFKGTIGDRYEIDSLPVGALTMRVGGEFVRENMDYLGEKLVKLRPSHFSGPRGFKGKIDSSKKVYPELMVLVNNELLPEMLDTYVRYTKIVEYILTYFNAVDLMYSKLENLKIEINIAGIIIEEGIDVFPMVYDSENICPTNKARPAVKSDLVLSEIGNVFYQLRDKFPRDSYDYILYMLNSTMCDSKTKRRVIGDTSVPSLYYRVFHLEDVHQRVFPVSVLDNRKGLTGFIAANHEIAHFMHVRHDSYEDADFGIMRTNDDLCSDCLTWSKNSTESITRYLSMADHCYLINRPRSLLGPGPQSMVTADEQCTCYGLGKSYKNEVMCSEFIKCLKVNDDEAAEDFIKGPKPLDGTPCGDDRVCWNGDCVHLST